MDQHSEQTNPMSGGLSARQLDLLVREVDVLPTTPDVLSRLLQQISESPDDEDSTVPGWWDGAIELIRSDPGLTARVLRSANLDAPDRIRTVGEAVERMGVEGVRGAMLSVRLVETPSGDEDALDLAEFRRHCLAVGIAAGMIAETLHLPLAPDEAFTCGLLHDLGKLVLSQMLPKSYRRVLSAARVHGGNIADCEQRILGTDHTVVGRRVAEQWGLGRTVEQVVWMHHQPIEAIPSSLSARRLVGTVSLADAIARRGEIGFSGNYTFASPLAALAARMQLGEKELDEIVASLPGRVEQRMELPGLSNPADGAHRDTLTIANAELSRLNERLRRRVGGLTHRAEAFEHLRRLAGTLSGSSTVADTLADIARLLAAAGERPDENLPTVVYSIDDEAREVLSVRLQGAEGPAWRSLACGEGFDPKRGGEVSDEPDEALEAILDCPEDLADWIDAEGGRHQGLICAERWVGGVVYRPDADASSQEVVEALAPALAMTLAIVQSRCKAVALSEQLTATAHTLTETQTALADAKAIAAAGEMAAGAAHEMNTPLAVVSGRAQMMCEQADTEAERNTWRLIAEQAQRISDTITTLMEFASPPPPRPEPFDIRQLLREATNLFSSSDHLQAKTASVDIQIALGVAPVRADRDQIRTAIAELITNAATAGASRGPIEVSAGNDPTGGAVVITVADSGDGMDERTAEQAFTPFFSLQKAGRRRGLGLPMVKRYVESNGGRVWIRSRLGGGTSVYVELPAARGGAESGESSDAR